MFKAANKDSSPPSSVPPPPPPPAQAGSSCLSSQAAKLRVTAEGLNIVGDGGVLVTGKKSNSQKEQKQKFFATRSADGHWNLLMAPTSDPSRLFLVQPAPGHKFQMTGGKAPQESADTLAENNSANGSSANGCEEDLPSGLPTPESVEQTPGTSKSIAVPVAQLRVSSGVNHTSSTLTTAATTASNVATVTTASTGEVQSCCPIEPKKPAFFKSRTSKDREALKASVQHALGKNVLFMNRRGNKSAVTVQGGHTSKGKKGKAAGASKPHKGLSPSSSASDEHSLCSVDLPNPAFVVTSTSTTSVAFSDVTTTASPSYKSSTSVTHSSSLSTVSSGEVMSVLDFNMDSSPPPSPQGNSASEVSSSITSQLLTLTTQTRDTSRSKDSSRSFETSHSKDSSGDVQDFNNTVADDPEMKTCDQQSKVPDDDSSYDSASDDDIRDVVAGLDTSAEHSLTKDVSESSKSPQHCGGSADNGNSAGLQSSSQFADNQDSCSAGDSLQVDKSPHGGVDSVHSVNKEDQGSPGLTSKVSHDSEPVSCRSSDSCGEKDSSTVKGLDSDNLVHSRRSKPARKQTKTSVNRACEDQKPKDGFVSETNNSLHRTQQKTTARRGFSDFSSDTDDYEFALSDSEKETKKEECATVSLTEDDLTEEIASCVTDDLQDLTGDGDLMAKGSGKDFTEQDVGVIEIEEDSTHLERDKTSRSMLLRIVESLRSKRQSDSDKQTKTKQSETVSRSKDVEKITFSKVFENSESVEEKRQDSEESLQYVTDSTCKENSQSTDSQDKGNSQVTEETEVGGGSLVAAGRKQDNDVHSDIAAPRQVRKRKLSKVDGVIETSSQDLDIDLSSQSHAVADDSEFNSKESRAKKRKKRRSELENLLGFSSFDEMEVDEESKKQESDSVLVPLPARHNPIGEEELIFRKKKKKQKKKNLKIRFNVIANSDLNVGLGDGADLNVELSDGPPLKPLSPSSFISEPIVSSVNSERVGSANSEEPVVNMDVSQGVLPAEQKMASNKDPESLSTEVEHNSKDNDPESLSTEGGHHSKDSDPESVSTEGNHNNDNDPGSLPTESLNASTERVQEQSDEIVQDVQTGRHTVEKSKKKKKKKKKLKIVFGSGQMTSTREIPESVDLVSNSLTDPSSASAECHSENSASDVQGVSQPEPENSEQTDISGSVQQKKKRKKRLSELETLIHDQAAYVTPTNTIEETPDENIDNGSDVQRDHRTDVHAEHSTGVHADKTSLECNERDKEASEMDKGITQHDTITAESAMSRPSCEGNRSKMDVSGEKAELASGSTTEAQALPPADSLATAPGQQTVKDAVSKPKAKKKKDSLHGVKQKTDKAKKKKKKKKIPTAGVIVMSPVRSGSDLDATTIDRTGKDSVENPDLNSSVSQNDSLSSDPGILKDTSEVSDNDDDAEQRSNEAVRKFLTSRSFEEWELARMFGTPFVVLERLSEQDVFFMSRRFRNARVSSRTRCSDHCRLRTLGYLCELNLIKCKPPHIPGQSVPVTVPDLHGDDASKPTDEKTKKKKRKRKNKEPCEQDGGEKKKKKKRKDRAAAKGNDGDSDVIFVTDSASKTSSSAPKSQENKNPISTANPLPSFPSASLGRIRIVPPPTQLLGSSGQAITPVNPCLITVPSVSTTRTSSVPQVYTFPSFGGAGRPSNMPQVISIASLGSTASSANRIIIPPLFVNSSTTSSLKDATRASLTQAISNSLCKTRLGTPRTNVSIVASTVTPPVSSFSASVLPKGPILVQAAGTSQSSILPKGPILVQTTVPPPPAPVLSKGPLVVQATVASSTIPTTQGSNTTPKQFFVVQMGDKRVLVPATALNTTTTAPTVLTTNTTCLSSVSTATGRPLQSVVSPVSVTIQQSTSPAPTIITTSTTGLRQQPTPLIPGSMARIVLSNRRPTTIAPRTGPTASTLLFANRGGPRPNQAWTGPRTVDSHRRVMLTPNSQPQGVRVVLSGAGPLTSGTRFTVSSSRSGVFVTSRQPNSLVKVTSPRQTRPGKKVMTEEERMRKRARLEKKYPLPPGVVIKTEPESRGYSDEGKMTQASSAARVLLSTVPVGSGSRTQVSLTQPIPVLSAFRGNPIVIRQALPATSSIPRSTSLLGPLIIRMPNASSSTNTSTSSTSTAMTASSLLSSLNRVSTTSTSATLPLTYSLLSGRPRASGVTVVTPSVAVTSSSPLVSLLHSQTSAELRSIVTCTQTVTVPSAAPGTTSVASRSVSNRQQSNSEEEAIYIADSPPAEVQVSDTERVPNTRSVTPTVTSRTSSPSCSQGTSCVTSLSHPSDPLAPVPLSADSSVTTDVVYTSQSPIMLTSPMPSTSSSAPSSRMASLGAMWVRQAADSPNSLPSFDTSSLNSERMQRMKETLAKQMGSMSDERRQKALQTLLQRFQTASPIGNDSDEYSQPALDNSPVPLSTLNRSSEDTDSREDATCRQLSDTSNSVSESVEKDIASGNSLITQKESTSESHVTEGSCESREAMESGAGDTQTESGVTSVEQGEENSGVETLSQQRFEAQSVNNTHDADGDMLLFESNHTTDEPQQTTTAEEHTGCSDNMGISQNENVPHVNVLESAGEAGREEQMDSESNNTNHDVEISNNGASEPGAGCTNDPDDTTSEDQGDVDAHYRVITSSSEKDCAEANSGKDKNEAVLTDASTDNPECVNSQSDSQGGPS